MIRSLPEQQAPPARPSRTAPPVRLLHVCGRLRPGGITSFVLSTVSMNDRSRGRHDILITFADGPVPANLRGELHRLDWSPGRSVDCLRKTLELYRRYDAVAVHGAHPAVVLPLLLARKRCLLFQHGMSVGSGGAAKRFAKRLWYSILPGPLDGVVVCSTEFAAEKARERGIRLPRRRVCVVPFGTAVRRKGHGAAALDGRELVIGMAGRLVPQKRHALVLESLCAYPGTTSIRVLIAGEGSERAALMRLAAAAPSNVTVEFLGEVSDMPAFYDRLDLVVFPSVGESFGLVAAEAMRRSVPVAVFADVGGCLGLVDDGATGIVMRDGISGVAELWKRLDADPSELARMAGRLSRMDLRALHISRTRRALDRLVAPRETEPRRDPRRLCERYLNDGCLDRRDQLLSLLWPDLPFRRNAHRVRRALARPQSPAGRTAARPRRLLMQPYGGRCAAALAMQSFLERELSGDLVGAYVLGSIGTEEEIAYSDFDALAVVRDEVFTDPHRLAAVGSALCRARRIMHRHDPLQHHGWFVLRESDLLRYPEDYLPLAVLRRGKSLLPRQPHTLTIRASRPASMTAPFQRLAEGLLRRIGSRELPGDSFALKGFLSQVMLLPALYVQARDRRGVFKKDSFALARRDFTDDEWRIMDLVTSIRMEWTQQVRGLRRLMLETTSPPLRRLGRRIAPRVSPVLQPVLDDAFFAAIGSLVRRMQARLEGTAVSREDQRAVTVR